MCNMDLMQAEQTQVKQLRMESTSAGSKRELEGDSLDERHILLSGTNDLI